MNSREIVGSVFGIAIKIIVAVVVVMFVYKYAFVAYDYGYRIFGEKPITSGEGRDITVVISDGDGAKEIGEVLESKGLIRDAKLFVIQEKLSNYSGKIPSGEYVLNTSMTAEEMIEVMATGVSTVEEEDGNKSLEEMKEKISSEQSNEQVTVVGSQK